MKSILIKSQDRETHQIRSHDFNVELGVMVEGQYLLQHAHIPNTCYNVNASNNTFEIYTTDVPVWSEIVLDPGNYNANTLANEIRIKCDLVNPLNPFVVSVSSVTGKLTIATTSIQLGIRFKGKSTQLMGFTGDINNNNAYTGDNVIFLNYPVSIGLEIDSCDGDNYENAVSKTSGTLFIPMNLDFGFYRALPSSDFQQVVNFNRTRVLRIRIVDTSDGSLIDLNGGNYELLFTRV